MAEIKLEELLERIHCASAEELNPILDAITSRFGEVWPEWELVTLTVQGHSPEAHLAALQKSMDLIARK